MLRRKFSTINPKARRIFVLAMTCFSVPFGTAAASWRLKGQLDLTTDLIKIAISLAIFVAVISFLSWTLTSRSKLTKLRGGLAGVITALLTIPAPFAASGFKQGFVESFSEAGDGIFLAMINGIGTALFKSYYIFEDMTKMSIVALLSSVVVGILVAYWALKASSDKI